MYRYVALVWDHRDFFASREASRMSRRFQETQASWHLSLTQPGILVYTKPPSERALRTYDLPNGSGLVLGKLFSGSRTTHNEELGDFDRNYTWKSPLNDSRRFIREYWGNYIAFFTSGDGNQHLIFRDCSGRMPCYRTRHEAVELVFADIADLSLLELPTFSLNTTYLAAFIHDPDLQIKECGILGVYELLAGNCLVITRDSVRQFPLWDPNEICRERTVDDYQEALTLLRATTQLCVNAWSSVYENVLHSLSGGLDSAVVLGCLTKAPRVPAITCFNSFGDAPREDERNYARLAAQRAGAKLIECPLRSR